MSKKNKESDGINRYFQAVSELQQNVLTSQKPVMLEVAEKMAQTIANDRKIFAFGTGHSHMLAEEGFCRAGGLASVVPIFFSALMLHEDIPLSAQLERTPGLAAGLLDRAKVQKGDMIFVFSNSGVNHLPVEMAMEAKKRGLITVSMGSLDFAKKAPLSAIKKKLVDVADYYIDNGGIAGDGLVEIEGLEWKVGPSSTVIGAMVWNALVTETSRRLYEKKGDVPVCASQNMPGAIEHNAKVAEKWHLSGSHL
jgi:uncharacterized phosphosugar-binding protein